MPPDMGLGPLVANRKDDDLAIAGQLTQFSQSSSPVTTPGFVCFECVDMQRLILPPIFTLSNRTTSRL